MDIDQITEIERQMRDEHKKDIEALARLKRFIPQGVGGEEPLADSAAAAPSSSGITKTRKGTIRAGLVRLFAEDPNRVWTAQGLIAQMRSEGFEFKAKRPLFSVNGSLRGMVENGQVFVVEVGTGNAPNRYSATEPQTGTKVVEIQPNDSGDVSVSQTG